MLLVLVVVTSAVVLCISVLSIVYFVWKYGQLKKKIRLDNFLNEKSAIEMYDPVVKMTYRTAYVQQQHEEKQHVEEDEVDQRSFFLLDRKIKQASVKYKEPLVDATQINPSIYITEDYSSDITVDESVQSYDYSSASTVTKSETISGRHRMISKHQKVNKKSLSSPAGMGYLNPLDHNLQSKALHNLLKTSPSHPGHPSHMEMKQKHINDVMMSRLYKQGHAKSSKLDRVIQEYEYTEPQVDLNSNHQVKHFHKSDESLYNRKKSSEGMSHSASNSQSLDENSNFSKRNNSFRKTGFLNFTTEYFETKKVLEVFIQHLNLSNQTDVFGKKTFVRLYLEPGKQQKQDTQTQEVQAQDVQTQQIIPFDERFVFKKLNKNDFSKYKLRMKVYQRNEKNKKEILGKIEVALNSLNQTKKEVFCMKLYRKTSKENLVTGMNLTLCHHAAYNKLEVIVQDVKNIPRKIAKSFLNPYVSVSLFKETDVEQKDTHTKRYTRNPEFNESFDFNLSTNSETPLSVFCLVVSLNNHNLVGKDDVIGHVIFSMTSPNRDAAHMWRNVSELPHERLTEFFPLMNANDLWSFTDKTN